MSKNFFEIQAHERKKIWVVTILIFAAYLGAFFLAAFGLAVFLEPTIEKALVRSVSTALILALAALAIQLWFADRHGMRVILESFSARSPDPEDHYHQRLVRLVEEIGVAAGGVRAKPVIVPTLAANAFTLADSGQAVIGVTEGAVSTLNRDQTQAVVAHEMAHLVNRDCRLATWVCAMAAPFVALADALDKLDESENAFRNQAAGAAVRTIVSLLTFALSRERETRADAKAVELTRNPLALAEAIYRISRTDHFVGGTAGLLAPIFIVPSRLHPADERDSWPANLFSSHPPTRKRLDVLLRAAGTAMDDLVVGIAARPQAPPVQSIEDQLVEQQQWQLRDGETWSGPFHVAELAAQPGFGPNAWVRRAGAHDDGAPAFSDPVINHYLRRCRPGPTVVGPCPRCGAQLEKVIYEGLPVGKCFSCGGYLVAEMRVERLLKRREVAFSDAFLREVDAWLEKHSVARGPADSLETGEKSEPCPCPLCGKPMFRRFYSYQYFIQVDRCMECGQIWFDRKELELLQALVERTSDAVARTAAPPAE